MEDTICRCGYWYEEHDEIGFGCPRFEYSDELNTPEAIADRGGEHWGTCTCNLCEANWAPSPSHRP